MDTELKINGLNQVYGVVDKEAQVHLKDALH